MGGIYGIAGFEEDGLLEKMGRSVRHRGPDGEGKYVARGAMRPFQMGCRRLANIDPDGGWQPLHNEEGTISVMQNGLISNHAELRRELEAAGHRFRSRSDAEILPHGLEEWGIEGLLHRLHGLYAAVIYDARSHEVYLLRDRCGQKPLYYWHQGNQLLFASEAKALLCSAHVDARTNIRAIDAYLTLGYVPEPTTLWTDIAKLPAAHYLHLTANGTSSLKRYWQPTLIPVGSDDWKTEADYMAEFDSLFDLTAAAHLRSDTAVGVVHDGSLESLLLTHAAQQSAAEIPIYGVTSSGRSESSGHGRPTQPLVEGSRGAQPKDDTAERLQKLAWQLDSPIADGRGLATHALAERASGDVKVLVGAEGVDALFGDAAFHRIVTRAHALRAKTPRAMHHFITVPALKLVPQALVDFFTTSEAHPTAPAKPRLISFLKHLDSQDFHHSMIALRSLLGQEERRGLYADEFKSLSSQRWGRPEPEADKSGHLLDRALKLQFDHWLQDGVLSSLDKCALAHGIEYRCPYLDHRLIEFAFTLPPHLKLSTLRDKVLLRKLAAKRLPKSLSRQEKTGPARLMPTLFEQPTFQALKDDCLSETQIRQRGYFDPQAVKWLLHLADTADSSAQRQVLSLVMLELWHRTYSDQRGA